MTVSITGCELRSVSQHLKSGEHEWPLLARLSSPPDSTVEISCHLLLISLIDLLLIHLCLTTVSKTHTKYMKKVGYRIN
ncbi:Hypothetical predicted protein [Scomber scombrus]|uniref:Uncharacterized protein n=1 Tax=Scomber scombrus TaxID=13677 RepID=A0AAV1NUW7_SCOSC